MNNDPHQTSEPSVPFVYPDDEGEQPPAESSVPPGAETVLRELIDWLFPPKAKPSAVLLRAYALVWYIQPESIKQQTSRSQRALADYLNVSKASLSWHITALRKRFGFAASGARSEATRAKYAEAARQNAPKLTAARRKSAKARATGAAPQSGGAPGKKSLETGGGV